MFADKNKPFQHDLDLVVRNMSDKIDRALTQTDPVQKADSLLAIKEAVENEYRTLDTKTSEKGLAAQLKGLLVGGAGAIVTAIPLMLEAASTVRHLVGGAGIAGGLVGIGIMVKGLFDMSRTTETFHPKRHLLEKCDAELSALYAENPDYVLKAPTLQKRLQQEFNGVSPGFKISIDKNYEDIADEAHVRISGHKRNAAPKAGGGGSTFS